MKVQKLCVDIAVLRLENPQHEQKARFEKQPVDLAKRSTQR